MNIRESVDSIRDAARDHFGLSERRLVHDHQANDQSSQDTSNPNEQRLHLPRYDEVAYRTAEMFYPRKLHRDRRFEDFLNTILREVVKRRPMNEALAFEIATKTAIQLLAELRSPTQDAANE
jgi:hypothetical protein